MLWRSVLLMCVSGCYQTRFYRNVEAAGPVQDRWVSFFMYGLAGEQRIDVREFCPDGQVARITTGRNVGTEVVAALTLGIYTPAKVYVQCAKASKS